MKTKKFFHFFFFFTEFQEFTLRTTLFNFFLPQINTFSKKKKYSNVDKFKNPLKKKRRRYITRTIFNKRSLTRVSSSTSNDCFTIETNLPFGYFIIRARLERKSIEVDISIRIRTINLGTNVFI